MSFMVYVEFSFQGIEDLGESNVRLTDEGKSGTFVVDVEEDTLCL